MKPTNLILYLLTAMCSLMAVSCADEIPYQNGVIPEGDGTLSATITFTPAATSNLGGSRTAGNAIRTINSLCVLVYNTDGNLVKTYSYVPDVSGGEPYTNFDDYKCDQEGYEIIKDTDHLDGNEAHTDEDYTPQATFNLPGLPYGRYHIYAVANMGDLSTDESTFIDQNDKVVKIKEAIQTAEGLRNISLEWNKDDIDANNQMFGYFTPANNMESKGFDAPVLVFNQDKQEIHAWLKRAASKVTIAFDPSGLNQGVSIYIKNVTIRDIPRTCLLGKDNTPNKVEDLLNYRPSYSKPEDEIPSSDAIANTRFEYNADGLITEKDKHTGPAKTDGLLLQNSIREAIPKDAHTTTAPSLFFYENNQQPYYDDMTKDLNEEEKKRYYKPQQHSKKEDGTKNPDGVGTPIRDDKDDKDFKDRIPYGTYIEVEAYYISANPEKVSEGYIKYRFMLGKNVSNDYNAQRNYHFKLTLGFNGWANEPDWHIDYELPDPGIEVPPVFRVSYLYHQKSELPIRILGDCTDLKVEIIENNWAPYDPTSRNAFQVPNSPTADKPNSTYEFKWNTEAFGDPEYMENNEPVNYFGFLALHMHDLEETTTITTSFSAAANEKLKQHYIDAKEGEREFDKAALVLGSHECTEKLDNYIVNEVKDDLGKTLPNQKTLMLPVWTRAKTLISESGFSGNNPYEGYERKARLKITAIFSNGDKKEKEVTVLQVKRIVNPKGVWRAHDKTQPFDVTLLEAENANGRSNFQPFTSEGEWTAFIDAQTNNLGFSISPNQDTDGYEKDDTIHGYTGSTINFTINFGEPVGANESECAIVKVLYHGNQCMHKILIRKGYNNPITMGGKEWSSFSLYSATPKEGYTNEYDAVLTLNPLMLGSMFRRGSLDKGILVTNNMKENLAPFLPPNGAAFEITNSDTPETWTKIGYRNDVITTNRNNSLGLFHTSDGRQYRVPTYEDWVALTNDAEFGYGVVYGSAAKKPALKADEAYGLIDPHNKGLFDSEMGMRGIIAYKKESGDQIFFPMGKYGTGRRTQFNVQFVDNDKDKGRDQNYYGVLRYADVYAPLTISENANNLYRPIPYNLPIACGNIYWIDVYKPNVRVTDPHNAYGEGCLGWDLNYFNFDFNAYTANNYADACPIKFIVVK